MGRSLNVLDQDYLVKGEGGGGHWRNSGIEVCLYMCLLFHETTVWQCRYLDTQSIEYQEHYI